MWIFAYRQWGRRNIKTHSANFLMLLSVAVLLLNSGSTDTHTQASFSNDKRVSVLKWVCGTLWGKKGYFLHLFTQTVDTRTNAEHPFQILRLSLNILYNQTWHLIRPAMKLNAADLNLKMLIFLLSDFYSFYQLFSLNALLLYII